MIETKNKIQQVLFRAFIGGVIFWASFGVVGAQSSSTNYKAVDFINSEAGLSTSSNYKLNDSIDYYGGVHTSSSYVECTGDFAVLSECSAVSPSPPPPPPPSPVDPLDDSFGGCLDCLHEPEFPEEPPKEPSSVEPDVPFILPAIEEPLPLSDEPKPEVVPDIPSVVVSVKKPVTRKPVTREPVLILPQEHLHSVAPEYCFDLTCSEANLLRPVEVDTYEGVCRIYSFGGFGYNINCSDYYMIWLGLLFFVIGMFPIGIQAVRVKRKKRKK